MRTRRYVAAGVGIILAVILAVVLRPRDTGRSTTASHEPAVTESEAVGEPEAEGEPELEGEGARAGSAEVQEEQEVTAKRLEALQVAKAAGKFGTVAATTNPATGWVGSRAMSQSFDDWEPAVATDAHAPWVYLLTTRYGSDPPDCAHHCPSPFLALAISKDGGATFGTQKPVCLCLGSKAQYDPTIEVVRNTGAVYSVFLNADRHNGFSTVFTKSTDHGATWSDPVHVYGNVSWTDKPEVATSPSGKDIYVSWNGPQVGDLYVGQSHDYGRTWTQQKLSDDKRYYYAYDARVLSDGTALFSESSIQYSGAKSVEGEVWHHAVISRDKGKTWENRIVAKVPIGESCVADGCNPDFYIGQTSVVSDAPGHLVFAYEGPTVSGGPQRVYVSRSSDGGRTWSAGTPLSAPGENATQPRLASSGGGDARIWYMQTADGDNPDAWNVWYRGSANGGTSWSAPLKIDDAPAGAAGYVYADGFGEVYGDYGEIAVTNTGKTVAVWGEGFSYTGPGGSWFNIQR
jgi:BNR repeat-like domain